ncbi:MAG: hypothetical protein JO303_01775 [Caulobacteraceae bacterium]|nr:hypothetical protein [Caulobacteraceae bacterium]
MAGVATCAVASSAFAADPTSIFGKWIEKLPNGNGMVTVLSASALSSYPVDATGKPDAAAYDMNVSYKDLGGPTWKSILKAAEGS